MTSTVSLEKFKEMRFATVVNEDGTEEVVELCIPSVTQVSRKGRLEVIFNREIEPLSAKDIFDIENSGVL